MDLDVLLRAPRVITGGAEVPRSVGIRDGRIVTVAALDAPLTAATVIELTEQEVLLPGLVDSHVHINEPGRTAWEGFASATRAAAAGGVTTLVDMPLNSIPPTCDRPALAVKRKAAEGQSYVDVGFWGGAIPASLGHLRDLHEAGVFGFKCFLLDSGVPEFPPLDRAQLEAAMAEIAAFDGLLIVHAEDAASISDASGERYRDFLASRPRSAENLAVAAVIEAAIRTGARVHLLHLSSCEALPLIARARADGARLTVETCPHYLCLSAEEVPDGATQFKCCPPIREKANQDALWEGLRAGLIDCVVSDHSPCTPELKRLDTGDFGQAWGGVASVQLALPAMWTEARARGVGLTELARWMAQGPAELCGLRAKGQIGVGFEADLCVFAPQSAFTVDPAALHHKNPITPYAGRQLAGTVRSTWLRGRQINDDSVVSAQPSGALLTRSET